MTLSGSPYDFLLVFLGGVAVSFTPCIYPIIPVSIGYIGTHSSGSKLKGFSLSLVYVTGVAITYSVLGILATLTGKLFGAFSSSPLTYIFTGIIIIIFGLSMFDLFHLPLPRGRVRELKKQNYFSTFLLGLSSGLVVSPCLTPVLGAILTYLTAKNNNNHFYGALLLFSFAYGMGFVLIIAGTFSSVLMNLPKSGKWMRYIKIFFGLVLILTGAYFIYTGIRRI